MLPDGPVMTLHPATPAHIALMQRRLDVAMDVQQLTHAVTILHEGAPLCCWGVTPLWDRVGVAWFLERHSLAGHPYARRIARAVRRTWGEWQHDFRYVEALVVADRDDSKRLIEWCGFRLAGCKDGYGPGGETMLEYCWRETDGH